MREILSGELVYIYEGIGEIDQNEGRGGQRTIGYFHTHDEATEAVKSEGVMGTPGKIKPVQALKQKLDDGRFNLWLVKKIELEDLETIRKRALAKLTPAERKALGL